jgi:hypothetical protein
LLKSIVQGRLQEKGIAPDRELVVVQTHASLVQAVLDAGGTRNQGCQLAHVSDVGEDTALAQGFDVRRLIKNIRDRTGKTFALAHVPLRTDIAGLLWEGASAIRSTAPSGDAWKPFQDLVVALGLDVPGTRRKRPRNTVKAGGPFGFDDRGEDGDDDNLDTEYEVVDGPDIGTMLAADSELTVPETCGQSVPPVSDGDPPSGRHTQRRKRRRRAIYLLRRVGGHLSARVRGPGLLQPQIGSTPLESHASQMASAFLGVTGGNSSIRKFTFERGRWASNRSCTTRPSRV